MTTAPLLVLTLSGPGSRVRILTDEPVRVAMRRAGITWIARGSDLLEIMGAKDDLVPVMEAIQGVESPVGSRLACACSRGCHHADDDPRFRP